MKKFTILTAIFLLCAATLFAQAPEKFTYQAVVRNASNALVTNAQVGLRVSILQGNEFGGAVYVELHTASTNANGLMTVEIGGGVVQQGSFASINWANGPYFLKTETDPNGGNSYSVTSVQQLQSVPYALYSKEAGNGFSGDYNDLINVPQIPQIPADISAFNNDAGYITMDSVPAIPTNVSAFNNDAGYLTNYTEIDPQFNAWDKDYNDLINKPTIPQSVGELTNDANYITLEQVPAQVNADWNATTGAAEILNKPEIPTVPTNVSAFNNDAGYITAQDIPEIPTVPTNVSAFTNDAGYLTCYTETDPQFNAWDKDYNDLTNKPELFSGNYNDLTNKPNLFSGNYNDLTNKPTNADFGQGIVRTNVSNPAGATDIVVPFTGYSLENGGVVSLGFVRNVPAGATLNINNKGAKPIRWKGVALTDGVIKAGDRCLFMYNSGNENYYLLAIDRWGADIDALAAVARTGSYNDLTDRPSIPTVPTNVGAFSNDAGYITLEQVPEQVNADWNATSGVAQILNKPTIPTVPTDVSAFANDAGYLTGYTETDPQFNAWDKDYNDLTNKPELFSGNYNDLTNRPNLFSGNYNDLTNKPTNADFGQGIVRTNVSNSVGATNIAVTFTNYSLETGGVVSLAFTNNVPASATLNINNKGAKPIRWRGSALPAGIIKAGDRCLFMYNSGNESYYLLAIDRWGVDIETLATVAHTGNYNDLTNKPTLFSGNYNDLTNKPTIPQSVGELTNDANYITLEQVPAQVNADWNATTGAAEILNKPEIPTVPTNVSAFNNDAGYITAQDIPEIPTVPTNVSAFNNDADYITQAQVPAQVNADWNATTGAAQILNKPTLFSGNYNDLTNKPTIPTVPTNVSAFANDMGYLTAIPDSLGGISVESDPVFSSWNRDYNDLTNRPELFSGDYNDLTNKPSLATVATTGSYNDLTDKPTIPTVPTDVSAFHNDAGYITQAQVPAQVNADWNATSGAAQILNKPTIPTVPSAVSAFTNDAGYITQAQIPAQVNVDWNATSGAAQILNKPTIPTVPSNVSVFNNDANYITNTGSTCDNAIDLCNLLNTIEDLQNQVQELSNMISGSPYGTASSDTCPQRMVMIDGNPNVCYEGLNVNNVVLVAWIDGAYDSYATYTWYESGQYRPNPNDGPANYYVGYWQPTYDNPYIFTVKVTRSDGCSYTSAPFKVNVYDKPYATITGTASEVCTGGEVTLRANLRNYNDPMITFQWYEGVVDNAHALPGRTHEVETFSPTATTDYIVDVTHLMDYGSPNCVASDTFRVEVEECDTTGGNQGTDTTQTSQHVITISMTTDLYPEDNTWQVIDASNNTVLASGGPYSTTYTPQNIPDIFVDGTGCYIFIIYDSYGDGIGTSGVGNYAVTYDSVVMGSGSGNSFSQEGYLLNPSSSSCPPDEMSLTSLDISSYQGLNSNFQVKGKVTNNGAIPITSYKVKYRVDGGIWSSDYNATCNIVPFGTANFTHNVPASISTTGQHTLEVMTFHPNGNSDDETDNSMSMEIVVSRTPEGDAQPCPGIHTITDVDGNVYSTVQIGSQCWLAENLRATKYADGTDIPLGTDTSSTTSYRYNPNNYADNVATYGYLYNWPAVMHDAASSDANPSGVQGVCPTGWHVPSDAEWTQLTDYVSGQAAYYCNNSSNIAKALASTTGWYSRSNNCAVGNELSSNNATGFSAMPAGYRHYGGTNSFRNYAYFWSATKNSNGNVQYRSLYSDNANVSSGSNGKFYGCSVRCLRDGNPTTAFPGVTTNDVSNITENSATCGGNVTSEGGSVVTACGVCWSTSTNPTLAGSYTTDSNGTGSFTSNITGLSPNTTYHVRAYATNSAGTSYGNDVSFTTADPPVDGQPCPNMATVSDYDGNSYNTVQIGTQCWMKQNLRTTHYSDGSNIPTGSSASASTAYRYNPNNNPANVPSFGYLYNWKAVMQNSISSGTNPSGVQGICPSGWHVPSNAEWTVLTNYLSSNSQYVCGNNNDYIAKALASANGWSTDNTFCAVGDNLNSNNTTGFEAMPAGYYRDCRKSPKQV